LIGDDFVLKSVNVSVFFSCYKNVVFVWIELMAIGCKFKVQHKRRWIRFCKFLVILEILEFFLFFLEIMIKVGINAGKINRVGKRKRDPRNYSSSSSNIRVHPLSPHSMMKFHYDKIFVTSNLTLMPLNNLPIQTKITLHYLLL